MESKHPHASVPWAFFRLSPFPQIAIRVMQMVNKEDVPLDKVSTLIASDPAFAAELLTIANSPIYAPRVPANTVLQAVSRIGTRHIQGLCLTVAVRAYLGETINHPAMQAIWHHNLATALIAEELAIVFSLDKDLAYTAGILHDIGRLAMAVLKPHDYSELLHHHTGTPSSMLEAEWSVFGFDHCEAGQQMIASWNLPHDFTAVVGDHHDAMQANSEWTIPRIIRLSCQLADACGYSAFQGCEVLPYPDLFMQIPTAQRPGFHPNLEDLTVDIHNKIVSIEHPQTV